MSKPETILPSPREIEEGKTARGGFTHATMKKWGVYPPYKGWRRDLEERWWREVGRPQMLERQGGEDPAVTALKDFATSKLVAEIRELRRENEILRHKVKTFETDPARPRILPALDCAQPEPPPHDRPPWE